MHDDCLRGSNRRDVGDHCGQCKRGLFERFFDRASEAADSDISAMRVMFPAAHCVSATRLPRQPLLSNASSHKAPKHGPARVTITSDLRYIRVRIGSQRIWLFFE